MVDWEVDTLTNDVIMKLEIKEKLLKTKNSYEFKTGILFFSGYIEM